MAVELAQIDDSYIFSGGQKPAQAPPRMPEHRPSIDGNGPSMDKEPKLTTLTRLKRSEAWLGAAPTCPGLPIIDEYRAVGTSGTTRTAVPGPGTVPAAATLQGCGRGG